MQSSIFVVRSLKNKIKIYFKIIGCNIYYNIILLKQSERAQDQYLVYRLCLGSISSECVCLCASKSVPCERLQPARHRGWQFAELKLPRVPAPPLHMVCKLFVQVLRAHYPERILCNDYSNSRTIIIWVRPKWVSQFCAALGTAA